MNQIPNDPKCPKSMQFILDCLHQCKANHGCNAKKSGPKVLPSRIVRIGEIPEDLRVKMYQLSDGPYIAISHCWGDNISLQLRSASQALFDKTDHHLLPRTFADAVFLTFHFGYRNLWIDCLCICQDSKLDWAEESAKMGEIYRNAELTIAGALSASSKESFLKCRDAIADPTIDVTFIDAAKRSYGLKACRFMELHEDTENGPLHQRAWCLQEYFLSTRIVSYENSEIRWRCSKEAACQCSSATRLPSKTYEVLLNPDNFEPWEVLNVWTEIVVRYSARKLTFATDRLPALAGVASIIQKTTKWAYLGGLWTDEIVRSLCWSTAARPLPEDATLPALPSFS